MNAPRYWTHECGQISRREWSDRSSRSNTPAIQCYNAHQTAKSIVCPFIQFLPRMHAFDALQTQKALLSSNFCIIDRWKSVLELVEITIAIEHDCMPPVPSFVFLPSLFLPGLKCVSHIKAPLTITNWILALLGHWTNAQIIFIVSECYDKGGLRSGGDLTQHWLYRRAKIDNSLLLLHEIDSSFVFQTDCCSTWGCGWIQKVCQIKTAILSMLWSCLQFV